MEETSAAPAAIVPSADIFPLKKLQTTLSGSMIGTPLTPSPALVIDTRVELDATMSDLMFAISRLRPHPVVLFTEIAGGVPPITSDTLVQRLTPIENVTELMMIAHDEQLSVI